jgi:rhodanese-related sulfurtransferase
MPTGIVRDDLHKLLENGAQLVDVLPRKEYEEEHLHGAISLPLKELNRETASRLRRDMPVIVYCHDYQ